MELHKSNGLLDVIRWNGMYETEPLNWVSLAEENCDFRFIKIKLRDY